MLILLAAICGAISLLKEKHTAISSLYYPSRTRTRTKTGQRWVEQLSLDGAFNVLKEFWPDIRHNVLKK